MKARVTMHNSFLYPPISHIIPGADEGNDMEIIESDKALSDCILWPILENHYRHQKMNAWDDVPSYATNNRFIGEVYADLVLSLLLDISSHLDANAPIYIVEPAAGSGCFAAHFLEAFDAKRHYFKALQNVNIQYVLTDFSDMNFQMWAKQPRFQPFRDSGQLHFALFRPECDEEIRCLDSDLVINQQTLKNPLIILANYFFDSIRQDLFMMKNNTLNEVRLSFFRELTETVQANSPVRMGQLRSFETLAPLALPYYVEPEFNQLLQYYQEELNETPFLLPIGGLTCIRNFQKLSGNRLIILSSDKGVTELSDLGSQVNYDVHGDGFSFFVNFHAIQHYMAQQDGQSLQTKDSRLITNINVLLPGESLSLEQTRYYFQENLVKRNSILNHCYSMYLTVDDLTPANQLRAFLAHLEERRDEPMALLLLGPRLMAIIPALSEAHKGELCQALHRVRANLFRLQNLPDLWALLAAFYYHCGYPKECLDLLGTSTELYGDTAINLYYRAVAQEWCDCPEEAIITFQQLLRLNPDCSQAVIGLQRLGKPSAERDSLILQPDLTYFNQIIQSRDRRKAK